MQDNNTLDVIAGQTFRPEPPGLRNIAHAVYALHAVALSIGLLSASTVVGSFVFGLPSIAAVVLNYLKRDEAKGTILESHFEWQITTFWWAASIFAVLLLFALTIIGLPIYWLGLIGLAGWLIYRVVRGWLALNEGKPIIGT